MIDVKEAVRSARAYAQEVLGESSPSVEEIERDEFKKHDVWRITLGFPIASRFNLNGTTKEYKSFFVDAQTGDTLAMKIRELTA